MRPGVRTATLDGYLGLARSARLDPARICQRRYRRRRPGGSRQVGAGSGGLAGAGAVGQRVGTRGLRRLRLAGLRRLATLGPLSVVLSQEPDLRSALTLLGRQSSSTRPSLADRAGVVLGFWDPVSTGPSARGSITALAVCVCIESPLGHSIAPAFLQVSSPGRFDVAALDATLVLFLLRPGVGDLVFPPLVSSTLVLIAMALSVFKPWGKIRRSGAQRPTER
jgi:hypothetical protein